jgi:small subunit ribosomal protein S2
VADGLISRAGAADTDQKPSEDQFTATSDEPLPEWERDLLAGSAAAPAEEVQESPVTTEADADAEIAEAAPEAAATETASPEAAPETAAPEAAADDAE